MGKFVFLAEIGVNCSVPDFLKKNLDTHNKEVQKISKLAL